jgi:hypothetical protein
MRQKFVWLMLLSWPAVAHAQAPRLLEVRRIWDQAPHNAFTDLIRFQDRWFCAFREGSKHVAPDGAIRVLTSDDGKAWASAARIESATSDLRDAKLSLHPDGRLMLLAAAALRPPDVGKHQTFAWFSRDGKDWGQATPIGERDVWLWRATWHDGAAYGVGYGTGDNGRFARLYRSPDGVQFDTLVPTLFDRGFPNESALLFRPDGSALCLLRRDGKEATGQLGRSRPPFTDWTWTDLGVKIGGPALLALPDGRIVAGVRLHDGKVRTALCWLDPEAGKLTEFLPLPSGGDSSYPGLAWHDGKLWVSYYSSHEGKANIYLAEVDVPRP